MVYGLYLMVINILTMDPLISKLEYNYNVTHIIFSSSANPLLMLLFGYCEYILIPNFFVIIVVLPVIFLFAVDKMSYVAVKCEKSGKST